jgi:hypothetical protein
MAQSTYFKRLKEDCKKISPHIKFKYCGLGFWRIYYNQAYLHEVYEDMGLAGFDITIENPRLRDRKFFEEYEDHIETVRTVKNFVEGYQDSLERIRTRIYMHRHDKEFNQEAEEAYKTFMVK